MQTENSLPSAVNLAKLTIVEGDHQKPSNKLPPLLNSGSVLALHKHFAQPDLTKNISSLTDILMSPASPARSQPSLSLSLEEPGDRVFGLDISDRVINRKKSDLSSEPGFIQSSGKSSSQITGSLAGDEQDPYSLLKLPEDDQPSPREYDFDGLGREESPESDFNLYRPLERNPENQEKLKQFWLNVQKKPLKQMLECSGIKQLPSCDHMN